MEIRLRLTSDDLVSVAAAAKDIGCTRQTVYRWLRKQKMVSLEIAGQLCIPRDEVERIKNKIGAGPPGEGDPVSAEGGALD